LIFLYFRLYIIDNKIVRGIKIVIKIKYIFFSANVLKVNIFKLLINSWIINELIKKIKEAIKIEIINIINIFIKIKKEII